MKTPHFAFLLAAALAPQAIAQDSSPAPWDGLLEGIQDSFVARRAGTVDGTDPGGFYRIGNYPILDNLAAGESIDEETVCEIVAASEDGMTLIYTDSEMERLGFVDITDPADPHGMGFVQLPGEPTAVSVSGDYALCAINTSANFVDTSGDLLVVDIASQTIVRTMPLGGQPDSVAVSPDGQFCAIAIENERDEDDPATGGAPPQLPAGYLVIIDLIGHDPNNWTLRTVDLTGIADLYPEDPEPEFVDISALNICAVTLQENNHIVLVELHSGAVVWDFSCGTVDLVDIDTNENGLIEQNTSLTAVPREPDAVTWISPFTLATADEGDLDGGSRGFTVWSIFGRTEIETGNFLEHMTAALGHYPEERSENKGNEPEGVEYASYGGFDFLFVGSERAGVVSAYLLDRSSASGLGLGMELWDVMPAGVGPEGLLAIPARDLFIVANEKDDRGDKLRASLMIYEYGFADADSALYPQFGDATWDPATGGAPLASIGALSGMTASPFAPGGDEAVFGVHDSFYGRSSVYFGGPFFQNNVSVVYGLGGVWPIEDTNGRLENALQRVKFALPNTPEFQIGDIINADGTVNLDLEGIGATVDGSGDPVFYVVSEGTGNLSGGVSDPNDRPFERPNVILELKIASTPLGGGGGGPINATLEITRVIGLPFALLAEQLRFGLEGVCVGNDGALYVCFQRAWQGFGDPADRARIGRFDLSTGQWGFAYYPLEAPASANGGWVGLSEIANVGDGRLAVIERDNQGNVDAAIKRIYSFDPASVTFTADPSVTPHTLAKTLEFDVLTSGLFEAVSVLPLEKLESMIILPNGDVWIANDNDGVDDNSGETCVFPIYGLFD